MYKVVSDDYIISVNNVRIGTEITEEEYKLICKALKNKPVKEGYIYKLRNDLTWVEYEVIHSEETTDEYAEAGKILLGVTE